MNSLIKIMIDKQQIIYKAFHSLTKSFTLPTCLILCQSLCTGIAGSSVSAGVPVNTKFSQGAQLSHTGFYTFMHTHTGTSALAISNTCTQTHTDSILYCGKKEGGEGGEKLKEMKEIKTFQFRHPLLPHRLYVHVIYNFTCRDMLLLPCILSESTH